MASSFLRLRAWVALVTFSVTFGMGLATVGHFAPDDDAACGQISLASDHAGTQFETIKLAPTATHCPFCHWQRAVSGASVSADDVATFQLQAVDRLTPPDTRAVGSAAIDPHPSRGPPSFNA